MKICLLLYLVMLSKLVLAGGENGRNVIIHDLNQEFTYELSGRYGWDGDNGSDGHSGRCYTDDDSVAGGHGENGKDGGNGGDGGNAVVHYSNLKDLQKLKIISKGGKGGHGGKGGSGGFGCGGSWNGIDGKPGEDGSDGRMGSLYLVKHPSVYEKDQTDKKVSLELLMKNEVIMVENIWGKASGALNLLSRGSIVSDSYYILNRTFKKKIVIKWLAGTDPAQYGKVETTLNLQKEKLEINFSGFVADQSVLVLEDQIEISIYNFIKESEIFKLNSPKFSGIDTEIKLEFIDSSSPIENIKKKYEVTVLRMGLFNGIVTAYVLDAKDIILIRGNKVEMNIGKMNFESKYKKEGTRLLIHFDIYAEVNGQKKKKSFVAAYKVGTPGSSFERSRTDF